MKPLHATYYHTTYEAVRSDLNGEIVKRHVRVSGGISLPMSIDFDNHLREKTVAETTDVPFHIKIKIIKR